MNEKNILLTGGTGLVGSSIFNELASKCSTLNVIGRNKIASLENAHWIDFDILKTPIDRLRELLITTNIIVHNAASLKLGNTADEVDELQRVNIDFTKALLELAVECKVEKIIFTSSLSMLQKPLPALITEEAKINPLSFYSKSKYEGEKLVIEYAKKYGINYAIFRLSSPVTKKNNLLPNTVIKKWITQAQSGATLKIFGQGSRTQDFISVDDIAKAYWLSIVNINVNGIFNIAAGSSLSMANMAKLIADKFGVGYEFEGIDEQELDRWNISIDKAKKLLQFESSLTSTEVINQLLNHTSL